MDVALTLDTLSIPLWVEVVAVVAGALYGALTAVDHEFDVFGAASLGLISGLGGAMFRDVLIGEFGIYAFQHPVLIVAAFVAAGVVFYFRAVVQRLKWAMFSVDTISLGLFAVLGSERALHAGLSFVPVVMLGTITCIGGGIITDLVINEKPRVFKTGTFYATAGAAAAIVYVVLSAFLPVPRAIALIVALLVATGLRLLSERLGWRTSTSRDYTRTVVDIPRRVIGGRKPGEPL